MMIVSDSNFNTGAELHSVNTNPKNNTIPRLFSLFILFILFSVNLYSKNENSKVCFYIFASSSCDYCKNFIELYIEPLKEQYGAEYKILDLNKEHFFKIFLDKSLKYGIQSNPKVTVWIDNELITETEIPKKLPEKIIHFKSSKGIPYPGLEIQSPSTALKTQLNSVTYMAIFTAGLIDGINPCAFSTLIFFIAYLLLYQSSPKMILASGLIFIMVSFIIYFLLGIGLLKVLQTFSGFKTFAQMLYKIMGIFMILFGGISCYDSFLVKQGKGHKIILQLSDIQKKFLYRFIRDKTKWKIPLLGSALIASIVSLTEFTCTGQIYLPTLMYAVKENINFINSLILLVVYNMGFIIPLTAIFLVVFLGTKTHLLSSRLSKYLPAIKIITGLLFITLGIILLN